LELEAAIACVLRRLDNVWPPLAGAGQSKPQTYDWSGIMSKWIAVMAGEAKASMLGKG